MRLQCEKKCCEGDRKVGQTSTYIGSDEVADLHRPITFNLCFYRGKD